jgi:hypothetical protein
MRKAQPGISAGDPPQTIIGETHPSIHVDTEGSGCFVCRRPPVQVMIDLGG